MISKRLKNGILEDNPSAKDEVSFGGVSTSSPSPRDSIRVSTSGLTHKTLSFLFHDVYIIVLVWGKGYVHVELGVVEIWGVQKRKSTRGFFRYQTC